MREGDRPAGASPRRPLILASRSPRRSEILTTLHIPHRCVPALVDESVRPGEGAVAHVERLARTKAAAVARDRPDAWVLGGDTVVEVEGDLLGKPADREQAVRMLLRLAGREHRVHSGLALALPREGRKPDDDRGAAGPRRILTGVRTARVRFRGFGAAEARAYATTGEPMDKAGAYGIQERGAALVETVEGDYSAVVGLPVSLLVELLERAGRPYRFGAGTGGGPAPD